MNLTNKLVLLTLLVTAISAKRDESINLNYRSTPDYSTILVQAPTCPGPNESIKCEGLSNRYRTLDGTCNNLKYPWWGAVQTPYNRLIKPIPTCDSDAPRTDTLLDISGLPPAYEVVTVIGTVNGFDTAAETNQFFAMFALFVGHDLSATVPAYVDCECGSAEPECFNIQLSLQDQASTSLNRKCLNYVRSMDSKEAFVCAFDHREQLSNVTHYLDLSNIYGSNAKQNALVRTYADGKLRTDTVTIDQVTPETVIPTIMDINQCIDNDLGYSSGCFYGADNRAFIEPQVTAMYILFIREHNRIATELRKQNAHWSDGTLYEESRRILIAIYQNMVYGEFLPILIGDKKMKEFQLKPLTSGHGYFYNDKLYPNIYNEFATAAFQLQNFIAEIVNVDADITTDEFLTLDQLLWRQYLTYQYLEQFLEVLVKERSLGGNFYMSRSLQSKFKESPLIPVDKFGSLSALIVQQGRDHALDSYTQYELLASGGGNVATSFDDLKMDAAIQDAFESIYNDVTDIDLWMGLLAERRIVNAQVGKTQAFILGKQFQLLKFGDRFYYENGEDIVNRFSKEQLNSIRGYKANKFQCNNIKDLVAPFPARNVEFNANGFLVNGVNNDAITACSALDDIDFNLWKEVAKNNYY
jgi:peroxidase